MTTQDPPTSETGEKLLSAVERLVKSPEEIRALVDDLAGPAHDDPQILEDRAWASSLIIKHYSNRSAVAGGVGRCARTTAESTHDHRLAA